MAVYVLVLQVAADIACGNGQAALDISTHFTRVIGVDASPQQVAQAPPKSNITFHLGEAEKTTLTPASCDLATVAQAMHWFDLSRFYPEMSRILKPKGTLAIWGYTFARIAGGKNPDADAKAQAANVEIFEGTVGPYWDARRKLLDNEYAGMDPPDTLFENIERHRLTMEKEWTLAQVAGYATTWSAYASYCKEHGIVKGSDDDPAVVFLQKLLAAYKTDDPSFKTRMQFPIILILATRKG